MRPISRAPNAPQRIGNGGGVRPSARQPSGVPGVHGASVHPSTHADVHPSASSPAPRPNLHAEAARPVRVGRAGRSECRCRPAQRRAMPRREALSPPAPAKSRSTPACAGLWMYCRFDHLCRQRVSFSKQTSIRNSIPRVVTPTQRPLAAGVDAVERADYKSGTRRNYRQAHFQIFFNPLQMRCRAHGCLRMATAHA